MSVVPVDLIQPLGSMSKSVPLLIVTVEKSDSKSPFTVIVTEIIRTIVIIIILSR